MQVIKKQNKIFSAKMSTPSQLYKTESICYRELVDFAGSRGHVISGRGRTQDLRAQPLKFTAKQSL